ncbi:MAG: ribosome maturation factor RimM [Eubacteriales bacterium]|jgi:16S rRNA processing protein RimM|nr:ribosome maturation factor RimM [Eubacteriales bacterium]NLO15941.1 16S rRNA processing protein RimM [Clostridiales bacterium]
MKDSFLPIGEVLRPQGINGLSKIRADMDAAQQMLTLHAVYRKDGDTYVVVAFEDSAVREGFVFARLDGAASRDEAEKQRGVKLFMSRNDAPPLEEGRYYISDLIGCKVCNRNSTYLGTIREVLQPGANDVLVIDTDKGEMLLPMLPHVVLEVDIDSGIVTIDESILDEVAVFGD